MIEAKQTYAKDVDQVSQNWEALMDDEKSHNISNELSAFEIDITQIRNKMKQLPLA